MVSTEYTRWSGAVVVFAVAIVSYLAIPFYPLAFAIVFTVLATGVTLRYRTSGLLLTMLGLVPAYAFQYSNRFGGVWGIMILGLMLMIMFFTASLVRTGFNRFLGVGTGILAACLMATPAYIISLPLIIVLTSWYEDASKASAVSVYLGCYLPLLIFGSPIRTAPGSIVPLYSQVGNLTPALQIIDFYQVRSLMLSFGATIHGASIFNALQSYFSLGSVGWFYILLVILAIIFTHQISRLTGRIVGIFPKKTAGYLSLIPSLTGWLFFTLLLTGLRASLPYTTDAGGQTEIGLQLLFVVAGSITTSQIRMSIQNTRRTQELRDVIEATAKQLKERLERLLGMIDRGEKELGLKVISDLKLKVQNLHQQAMLILDVYESLDAAGLEDREHALTEIRAMTAADEEELNIKLAQSYLHLGEDYRLGLQKTEELATKRTSSVETSLDLTGKGSEEIMGLYLSLRERLAEVTTEVVMHIQTICEAVKDEFDPDLPMATANMAASLLDQKNYGEALKEAVQAVDSIMERIGSALNETLPQSEMITQNLIENLRGKLMPLAYQLEDDQFLSDLQSQLVLTEDRGDLKPRGTAYDILLLSKCKDLLRRIINPIMTVLDKRLVALEGEMTSSLPSTFGWNRNDQIHLDVAKFLRDAEIAHSVPGFKFTEIYERGFDLIRRLTETLDDYLTTIEFIRNYGNVERMIAARLQKANTLKSSDLPVNMALEYLRLYSLKHPESHFNGRNKTLSQDKMKPEEGKVEAK